MSPKLCHIAHIALFFWAGAACAQSTYKTKSGLLITDLSFGPQNWIHGCIERRFLIENPTPAKSTVTIELPGSRYDYRYHWNELSSLSGSVVLEGLSKAVLALPQPPIGISGDDRFAVVEKAYKTESFACKANDFGPRRSDDNASVLLSKALSAEKLSEQLAIFPVVQMRRRGRASTAPIKSICDAVPFRLELDVSVWPASWLAYTGFDGCLIADVDYRRMPEEVRDGLRAYAAAGGMVTFVGSGVAPDGWSEPGAKWKAVGENTGLSESRFGFGHVQTLAASDISGLSSNAAVALARGWDSSRCTPSSRGFVERSFQECIRDIPVGSGMKVPINLFLFTLLIFVLLAGPVALFYTRKANRRMWLMAIVPVSALLFSVCIIVSAFVVEGLTPLMRRQAITLLDQTRRQAVTLGAVGVYAPTSLNGGVLFDRGTEVDPLTYSRGGSYRRIVIGQGQHFAEGWVSPRMSAFFRLRRSEFRAERLVVTEKDSGSVEVINALGAAITRLTLNDGRGNILQTADLNAGEKRLLVRQAEVTRGKVIEEPFESVRGMYETSSPGWGLTTVGARLRNPPGPRTYVAELSGCPFIENPLGSRKVRETAFAVVAGKY